MENLRQLLYIQNVCHNGTVSWTFELEDDLGKYLVSKFVSSEVNTAYNAEADTIYKKNIIDFITGARSLETYDEFVKEWKAAGGEAYTKAFNEAYQSVSKTMDEAKKIFK